MKRKVPVRLLAVMGVLACAFALALALPISAAAVELPGFYGVVSDAETEQPIEGAWVEAQLMSEDEWHGFWTQTNANGEYRLPSPDAEGPMPAGDYWLYAGAYAYASQDAESYFDGTSSAGVDFALTPLELAFTGTVTDAVTGDPIAGAEIGASQRFGWEWFGTSTDEDGKYEVFATHNEYTLHASAYAYGRVSQSRLEFEGETQVVDFQLEPLEVAYYGTVTDAETSDPVAWAEIEFELQSYDEDEWYNVWVNADENGEYEAHLPAGTWRMQAYGWDYASVVLEDLEFDGATATQIDVALKPVWDAFYGYTIDASSEATVAWAWVELAYNDGKNVYSEFWETDETGYFEFRAPKGTSQLSAYASGYAQVVVDAGYDGGERVRKDLAFERHPLAFHGRVTDSATGEPLDYVEVSAYVEEDGFEYGTWAEADEDGYYEIYAPAANGWSLHVWSHGYAAQTLDSLNFNGTDALERNFALVAYDLAFFGKVMDETGKPLEGAWVSVSSYDDDWGFWDYAETDASGSYEVYAGPGEYTITAGADGYRRSGEDFYEFDSEAVEIDFELEVLPDLAADEYEVDNTPAQAKPISTDGELQERTFFPARDSDWIAVDVQAGGEYAFETHDVYGHGSTPFLRLYDSDGKTILAEDDGYWWGNEASVYWVADETKTVYLRVRDYGYYQGDTGDYGISAWVDGVVPPALPLAGANRYETAVQISQLAFPDGADTVVLATGENWPDALGGTGLAGVLDGPVLLSRRGVLPEVVLEEIYRLEASEIIIVGGEAAISMDVQELLEDEDFFVDRIYGENRYETANEIAMFVIGLQDEDFSGHAFVATGRNFPDALAAAPIAAASGMPLFLADPVTGLSADTKAAMDGVTDVAILGGESVVSKATENYLKGAYPNKVTRLSGSDRYATAVKVAEYAVSEHGHTYDRVGIATGLNFPDALAGGVLQGKFRSVMMLTPGSQLAPAVKTALEDNAEEIQGVTFFGGVNAVSQKVRDAVMTAVGLQWQ